MNGPTMDKKTDRIDAGLASLNHYKVRLPAWRHNLRQMLLPLVRWETPYVALFQERLRSPALDSYFAMSANLGTHTAFMVVIPILFWCGYLTTGRAILHVLAAGVFWSGFVKDLLCLPRPLSPPLQRITMSGSAALEYGFPSTHSTNAVSVAYCVLHILKHHELNISSTTTVVLQFVTYWYACSIVLGRLYCGMHGFLDVVLGSALGAAIGAIQCEYGPFMDDWMYNSPYKNLVIVILVIFVLVRIHPEPADDCPCFDDSVAFSGVVIGCEVASWQIAQQHRLQGRSSYEEIPFSIAELGWLTVIIRIIVGIAAVFTWRATMKPLLLKVLPPLFRNLEYFGLDLPRRFFMPASQYLKIPSRHQDDNIIPDARDIPGLLSNFNRRRAISIGPQSQADAIEAIAYRDKRRRDSLTKKPSRPTSRDGLVKGGHVLEVEPIATSTGTHTRKRSSSLDHFRAQMGSVTSLAQTGIDRPLVEDEAVDQDEQDRIDEKRLFESLKKPRVRYDVEVVTKLIVYTGIAWIAIGGSTPMFEILGLAG